MTTSLQNTLKELELEFKSLQKQEPNAPQSQIAFDEQRMPFTPISGDEENDTVTQQEPEAIQEEIDDGFSQFLRELSQTPMSVGMVFFLVGLFTGIGVKK